MKKKYLALLAAILMIFSCVPVFANETNAMVTLEEVQNNEQLKEEIDAYLNTKLDAPSSTYNYNVEEISTLQEYMINRSEGFYQIEERANIEISDVEVSSYIKGIVSQNEEQLVLQVYEWTEIEYYASADGELDVMGYGTDHEMTFENNEGEYILVSDSFDERLITGVCSNDVIARVDEVTSKNDVENEIGMQSSTYETRSFYDVQSAIIYANRYCGVAASSKNYANDSGVNTGTYNTSLYNQSYTIYAGVDCANFVSQCLAAGGLSTNGTWQGDSYAWVNARGLATYLISQGYSSYTATNSNVYPGNPVYWLNAVGASPSGHQMICTGYNSAGIPVVNAHNNDLFRVPISAFSRTLSTIHIVSSDQHTHVAEKGYHYSESAHFYTCKYCRENYNIEAHNVISTGSSQYCSVCGYIGPFASYYSLSVCGEPGTETRPLE